MSRVTFQEFYNEIVASGVCCGCGSCVVVCPINALTYVQDSEIPALVSRCTDCGVCFKACPRYQMPEEEIEKTIFSRNRGHEEVIGIQQKILATRSMDRDVLNVCQDGGLVSSLLIWGIENQKIDGAIVAAYDRNTLLSTPILINSRSKVLS